MLLLYVDYQEITINSRRRLRTFSVNKVFIVFHFRFLYLNHTPRSVSKVSHVPLRNNKRTLPERNVNFTFLCRASVFCSLLFFFILHALSFQSTTLSDPCLCCRFLWALKWLIHFHRESVTT